MTERKEGRKGGMGESKRKGWQIRRNYGKRSVDVFKDETMQ
jgi:hypothetical protein